MSSPRIRVERAADVATIAGVVAAAFGSQLQVELVEAIRACPQFLPDLSLIAELDGEIVGHVMISSATLEDGDTRHQIANLSPLAVHPTHQQQGIGSMLVREVTARADRRGEPLVILEGDPAYYGRFGFEPAAPQGIEMTLPSWAPPEAAQMLGLRGYEPSMRGRVRYPPAFDLVSHD